MKGKGRKKQVIERKETEWGRHKRLLMEDSDDGRAHRDSVYADLLQHLKEGYSFESFGLMSKDTIFLYCKSRADEGWDEEQVLHAAEKGRQMWEHLGVRQAQGTSMGNASAWKFAMSAKYGWSDKVEQNVNHAGNLQINVVSYAPTLLSH